MQDFAQDLAVNLQHDRPGTLAKALEALAGAKLNIDAYAEVEGILHLLTKDARAARRALETAGLSVRGEQEVLVLDAPNRPGVAAAIFRRIADAGVNVNFSYVAGTNRLVVGADNLRKVEELRLGGAV